MGNRSWQPWRQNIINAATKATWTGLGGGGACKGGHSQNSMLCMTHTQEKFARRAVIVPLYFSLFASLSQANPSRLKAAWQTFWQRQLNEKKLEENKEEEGRELVYSICHSIWQFDSFRFSCLIEFKTKRNIKANKHTLSLSLSHSLSFCLSVWPTLSPQREGREGGATPPRARHIFKFQTPPPPLAQSFPTPLRTYF